MALMRELEQRSVFVLPVRIDDSEVPPLLSYKLYADFRSDYGAAFDKLLEVMIPEQASSAMLRSVPELSLHYLPAVAKGRFVTAFDLNRVILAINAIEDRITLEKTDLSLFFKGQRIRHSDINRLMYPIERLRKALGLTTTWNHYPTHPGDPFTASHMNEIYARVNEAIERWA